MVLAIIFGQGVINPVEAKLSSGNAVGISTNEAAKKGASVDIVCQGIKPQYDIAQITPPGPEP